MIRTILSTLLVMSVFVGGADAAMMKKMHHMSMKHKCGKGMMMMHHKCTVHKMMMKKY